MDKALYSLWHRASAVVDERSMPEAASDPYPQIFHLIQSEDVPGVLIRWLTILA